jgi:hypothetical protein
MTSGAEVEVTVDPFSDHDRSQKYFDIDAVDNGIAILYVRVVNKTVDQTFVLKKENLHLSKNGAGELTGGGDKINTSDSMGAAQVMSVVGVGGLMGALGAAMIAHDDTVRMNFTNKEMGDQTLSPGQSTDGFVYFAPIKKGEDWTRGTVVQVKLIPTKDQPPLELKIPLAK